jgi:hypothetical protein
VGHGPWANPDVPASGLWNQMRLSSRHGRIHGLSGVRLSDIIVLEGLKPATPHGEGY